MPCNVPLGTPCYSLFARGKLVFQSEVLQPLIYKWFSYHGEDDAKVRVRVEFPIGEYEQQIWPPVTIQ